MRILVTGSNGFLGAYICNRLKESHDVIGIGRKVNSYVLDIKYCQGRIESKSFVKDISQKVKSCDVIIHLAAYIDKDNFNHNMIDVNCKGTLNIVELSKELNVKKIIHSSSLPIVGKPQILPIVEEYKENPNTLYHITKLTSEHIVNLSCLYDVKAINLRITSPIGIGMNENTILPVIIKRCLKNEDIIIYGNGLRMQNYIDVRDITSAIENAVEYDVQGNFNIASDMVISNIELARLCIKLTGSSSKILFNGQDDPEESYVWETSIEKARKLLSFEPKYSISETIIELIKYWRNKL